MTIVIDGELERRIVEKAAQRSRNPDELVAEILTDAIAWDDDDLEDAIKGSERGLADFEAGRYRPFSEFAAEQRAKYGLRT